MVTSLRSKWAVGKAVRAGLAVGGSIPHQFLQLCRSDFPRRLSKTGAGRNRRATQPSAHFQHNPPGRGQLAFFRVARLAHMNPDMGTSLSCAKSGL